MFVWGGGSFYILLTKDIKELNGIILSLVCITILLGAGFIAYRITNSYALFTSSVKGSETIGVSVGFPQDESGANEPVLSENMVAVYYDETDETWKIADYTNKSRANKWYDYDEKIWANSVTVNEESRNAYLNAKPGTEISMNDILTMQVWIPRYKYKIFNYNEAGTTYVDPQEIEITFEKEAETTGEVTCTDSISGTVDAPSETCKLKSNNSTCTDSTCNGKTYTHPAFTFGNEELTGIWVGKFETSTPKTSTCYTSPSEENCNVEGITPLVKPDVMSYRSAQVGTFESNMMAMNDSGNKYGFATTDDTHMMKNMEWGAVAYLSHSKYGINSEVYINNSSSYYTGRSGGNVGGQTPINETYTAQTSTTQYNDYGFYTYDGYLLNYGTNTKSTTKDMSKVASTTGNIYGIYDMSGGTIEYVMGNVVSPDGVTMFSGSTTSSNSGYTGMVGFYDDYWSYTGKYSYPENKYLDKYSCTYGGSTRRIRTKLGDAVKEVGISSEDNWYSSGGKVASDTWSWFRRGGIYHDGEGAGIFYSYYQDGRALDYHSTRVVISNP
ncbi:MAG: hypothetical protein ACI31R_04090 [Bacilli bacterium]